MSWQRRVFGTLRNLFGKQRVEQELDDELRFHLEKQVEQNVRAGMSPEEARRQAVLELGGVEQVKEQVREARAGFFIETLWQDVRFGARMLGHLPGFTLVAVLSLAIGIGGSTTAFSFVNALFFRPFPAKDPQRLVNLHKIEDSTERFLSISYPDYLDYREHNHVFSDFLLWSETPLGVVIGEETEAASGMLVSSNYFAVLGVEPALGRFFPPDTAAVPGGAPFVVVNHGYWSRRLGADPGVVGRAIRVNGQPFTIIGVAPQGFSSTLRGYAPDLFVPLAMQSQIQKRDRSQLRMSRHWKVTGRLRDGVSPEQAGAAFSVIDAQIQKANPERDSRKDRDGPVIAAALGALPGELHLAAVGLSGLLLAVPGTMLLIACANLASMLLARAAARRREIAVRLAVGASRGRLVRQLLTESVMIFLMAGAVGTLLAVWLRDLLLAFRPRSPIPFELDARFDFHVLAFTLLLSLLTGVIFGLAPALQASRADLHDALKDAPRRGMRRTRARDAFVVAQLALCLLLLVCAGLFGRALNHAKSLYPGKEPSTVWLAEFNLKQYGYSVERSREFYRRLIENVSAMPDVRSVGLARIVSGAMGHGNTGMQVEGSSQIDKTEANVVGPGYFQTLGVTLLRGREFTDADRLPLPGVAIVNESLARRYWPNEDAIGKHIRAGNTEGWLEIVGVAENGKYRMAGQQEPPLVYISFAHSNSDSPITLLMRVSGDPQRVMAAVRREVQRLDAGVPIESTMSLPEAIDLGVLPLRVAGAAANAFGAAGLLLAAIGIYGLVSYAVTQRTQEIGVRVALGATRSDIVRLVILRGLKLAAAGLGLGVVLALASTHVLAQLLFGIAPTDPATFVMVAFLLGATALLASWVPARRAARMDPVVALRYE